MIKAILGGTIGVVLALAITGSAEAQRKGDWKEGGRVEGYGPVAQGVVYDALDPDTKMSVAFDVSVQAREGSISRQLETVARFLNMHAQAGLRDENVKAAVVVHGQAVKDLLIPGQSGRPNLSKPLVEALIAAGASITVCAQSAAAQGITQDMLLPGIGMSLSAMTAHAQLKSEGYGLNPF